MKKMMKRLRLNFVLTSLLCIAFGVILIIYPETTSDIFCRVVGAVMVVCGILRIIGFLTGDSATFGARLMLVEGILLVVLGVFIIIKPEFIKALFAIIIGILLLIHGFMDFREAKSLRELQMKNWWIAVLFSIVTIGLGILLICRPIAEFEKMVILVGACLTVDGVSDFVVYIFWKHYERLFRKNEKSGSSIIEVVDGKVK